MLFNKTVLFPVAVTLYHLLTACTLPVNGEKVLRHLKLIDNDRIRLRKKSLGTVVSDFLSGEFIIEVATNTTNVLQTVEQMMIGSGGSINFVYTNLFKGAAISNMSDFSILKLLDKISVVQASRNAKVTISTDQQDAVWGIDRIISPLDDVYTYQYDGTGVQAYILDTGIKASHAEFNGRASCGYSAYNDNCEDGQGHGTHVAGTIGGKLYGVAKNVQLISVKILSDSGSGSITTVAAGLDYIVGEKTANPEIPMVINLSLGGIQSTFLNNKVDATVAAGITTVVAAGNSGMNACLFSPASAKRAITVGATTISDTLASYSNVGPCIDILAPGSEIKSAWVGISTTGTLTISGTSMASPHVAGIAVLHLSKDPSLTPGQVLSAIKADGIQNAIRIPRSPLDILFPRRRLTPNLLLTGTSLLQ